MKKLNIILVTLAVLALPVRAQTTNTGSFLSTVTGFFTSFNPDLEGTFATQRGEFATGVDSIGGTARTSALLANSIRISYDVYHPTNGTLSFSAEVIIRDSGIAGTLTDAAIGGAINFRVHDAKLSLYVNGLYDFTGSGSTGRLGDRLAAEIGIRASKALTTHTFMWVSAGVRIPDSARILSGGLGFVF